MTEIKNFNLEKKAYQNLESIMQRISEETHTNIICKTYELYENAEFSSNDIIVPYSFEEQKIISINSAYERSLFPRSVICAWIELNSDRFTLTMNDGTLFDISDQIAFMEEIGIYLSQKMSIWRRDEVQVAKYLKNHSPKLSFEETLMQQGRNYDYIRGNYVKCDFLSKIDKDTVKEIKGLYSAFGREGVINAFLSSKGEYDKENVNDSATAKLGELVERYSWNQILYCVAAITHTNLWELLL